MMGQVGTLCRLDLDKSVPGQVERLLHLDYTQLLQCRLLFQNYHLIKVCCNSGSIVSISGAEVCLGMAVVAQFPLDQHLVPSSGNKGMLEEQ